MLDQADEVASGPGGIGDAGDEVSTLATVATEASQPSKGPQCWICLGGAEDERTHGPLIQPCDCRGSQRLCHRDCITVWLKVRLGVDASAAAGSGVDGAGHRRPWWHHIVRYNTALPEGLDRLANDVRRRRVSQGLPAGLSVNCQVCGAPYMIRSKSVWELSWKQWRRVMLPAFGMLVAMLALCLKIYARLLRIGWSAAMSQRMDAIRAEIGEPGVLLPESAGTSLFPSMSWGSGFFGIYAVLSILKLGARAYNIISTFRDDVQTARAETIVVENHEHDD